MRANDDRIGIYAGAVEAVAGPFPDHLDVDSFTVAKVGGAVPLIDERPRDVYPERGGAPCVGSPTPEGPSPAFVFADRGGEKGNFDSSLSRKTTDVHGLEMPGPEAAIGGRARRSIAIRLVCRGAGSVQSGEQENSGGARAEQRSPRQFHRRRLSEQFDIYGVSLSNMRPMRRGPITVFFALLALLIFASTAGASCIKRHQVRIASGTSPSGWNWTVDGTIGNNGGNCRDWLFGMDFELEGVGNWGWGTGIPAGGHLDRHFDIESIDGLLEDGSYRVVAGTVNGEVAKILFTLSNNKRLTVRPLSPSESLRRKVVWLRNTRYFVDYYPPEAFVTGVATFSASGQLLYRDKSYEAF